VSPGWSLVVALAVILGVAWGAMRIMRKYIDGPDSKRER
jgi:flagellar biogenesis protein FliO